MTALWLTICWSCESMTTEESKTHVRCTVVLGASDWGSEPPRLAPRIARHNDVLPATNKAKAPLLSVNERHLPRS